MSNNWGNNFGNNQGVGRTGPKPPSLPPPNKNKTSHGAIPRNKFTNNATKAPGLPPNNGRAGKTGTSHGAKLKKKISSPQFKKPAHNDFKSSNKGGFKEDPFADSDDEQESSPQTNGFGFGSSKKSNFGSGNKFSSIQRKYSSNSQNQNKGSQKPLKREPSRPTFGITKKPSLNKGFGSSNKQNMFKLPETTSKEQNDQFGSFNNRQKQADNNTGGFQAPSPAQKSNFGGFQAPSPAQKSNFGGFQAPSPAQKSNFGGFQAPSPAQKSNFGGFQAPSGQQKNNFSNFDTPSPDQQPKSDFGGFKAPNSQQKSNFGGFSSKKQKPFGSSNNRNQPAFKKPEQQSSSTNFNSNLGAALNKGPRSAPTSFNNTPEQPVGARPKMALNLQAEIAKSGNDGSGSKKANISSKKSKAVQMKSMMASARNRATNIAQAGKKRATKILRRKTKNGLQNSQQSENDENEPQPITRNAPKFTKNSAFDKPFPAPNSFNSKPDNTGFNNNFGTNNSFPTKAPTTFNTAQNNNSFNAPAPSGNTGFNSNFNKTAKPTFNAPNNNSFNAPTPAPAGNTGFNSNFNKTAKPTFNAPKNNTSYSPPSTTPKNNGFGFQAKGNDFNTQNNDTFNAPNGNSFNNAPKQFNNSTFTSPPKKEFNFPAAQPKPMFNKPKNDFSIAQPKPMFSKPTANTSFNNQPKKSAFNAPKVNKPPVLMGTNDPTPVTGKVGFAGNLNMLLAGGKKPRQQQQTEIEAVPLAAAPKLAFNLQAEIQKASGGNGGGGKKSKPAGFKKKSFAPKKTAKPKQMNNFGNNQRKPPTTIPSQPTPFAKPTQFGNQPTNFGNFPNTKPPTLPPSKPIGFGTANRVPLEPSGKPTKPMGFGSMPSKPVARPPQRAPNPMKKMPLQDPRIKQVKTEAKQNLRESIKGMKGLASFWDDIGMKNKKKQELNPFSSNFAGKREVATENVFGSKSDERAQKAQEWTNREIDRVVQVIKDFGTFDSSSNKSNITFGELFLIYEKISDTLVFMLLKAKKRNRIYFDAGEMLLQGRDDHVIISVTH